MPLGFRPHPGGILDNSPTFQRWERSTEGTIIPDGTVLTIPKQPVLGGSGGNPLIWVQLLQGDGTPTNDPQFLGRCNKL